MNDLSLHSEKKRRVPHTHPQNGPEKINHPNIEETRTTSVRWCQEVEYPVQEMEYKEQKSTTDCLPHSYKSRVKNTKILTNK